MIERGCDVTPRVGAGRSFVSFVRVFANRFFITKLPIFETVAARIGWKNQELTELDCSKMAGILCAVVTRCVHNYRAHAYSLRHGLLTVPCMRRSEGRRCSSGGSSVTSGCVVWRPRTIRGREAAHRSGSSEPERTGAIAPRGPDRDV